MCRAHSVAIEELLDTAASISHMSSVECSVFCRISCVASNGHSFTTSLPTISSSVLLYLPSTLTPIHTVSFSLELYLRTVYRMVQRCY